LFFRGYRFEHPKTERSIIVGGPSFLWAGLFGVGYVWWIGYGSVLRALAVNLATIAAVVAVVLASSVLPPIYQLFVLLAVGPVAVVVQGSIMVSIIRTGFRRRGWMTRPA
jgi:hypothetical protein